MNYLLLDSFSKEALDSHNKYRAKHQSPPLKWSRSLAKDAEAWAQQLAKENSLRNADTDDGENIYGVSGKTDLKGSDPVEKWYDEIKKYNFSRPGFRSDIGHFTQVVWKATKEVGVGKAKSLDGKVFVVARYSPPGNVLNRFEQNIQAPKSADSPSSFSTSREYTSRTETRGSEPSVRSERTVYRSSDKPERSPRAEKKDDFFKGFEDMGLRRKDKGRADETKETVTYDRGPSRTVVTKVITSGDDGDGVRSYRREVRTTTYDDHDDDDFGRRRGRRNVDDDDDFFKKDFNWNSKPGTKWEEKREYSPKISRAETKPAKTGTGGSAPKSTTPIDKSFKKQCLDSHNKYRTMHSAPALRWSDDLAKESQYYAEKLAKQRTLQHSSKNERDDTGENLAMFTGRYDTAGDEASDMWYEEVNNYSFSRGGFQGGTGHFTQMVWKGSKELGMGRAKTADGRSTYVVARYRPAGNVVNYMAENVSPKRR